MKEEAMKICFMETTSIICEDEEIIMCEKFLARCNTKINFWRVNDENKES